MLEILSSLQKRFSPDTLAFFALVVCFFVIGTARLFLGFVPWYFALFLLPIFFLSLRRPLAGVAAILFLTVLFERFFTLEGFQFGRDVVKLYPLDAALLGVYAYATGKIFFGKAARTRTMPDMLFLLFFVVATLYFVASFFGFGAADVAFSTWKNYVFYGVLVFAMPLVVRDKHDIQMIARYFLTAALFALFFLVIGILRGGGVWTEYTPLSTDGVRFVAFPHAFYYSLALLGMFVMATMWTKQNNARMFFVTSLLFGIGILGSLMRHLWIGLAISLGMAFVFLLDNTARRIVLRMSAVTLAIFSAIFSGWLLCAFLFPVSPINEALFSVERVVVERVLSVGDISDESIAWRGSTWQSALSALSRNLFLGTGFGMQIPVENGAYRDFVEIRNVHNSWLALLVQTGLLGFVLFFGAIISFCWLAFVARPADIFLLTFKNVLVTVLFFQCIIFLAQPYLETNLLGIFFYFSLGTLRALLQISDQAELTRTLSSEPRV